MAVNQLVTSGSAIDFLDRIGVAAHSGAYVAGAYSSAQRVIAALNYAGISQVRNTFFADQDNLAFYKMLASTGVTFDFLAPTELAASGASGIAAFVGGIERLVAAAPHAIWAVEGANEVNIQPLSFNGDSSLTGASAFQRALFLAVKSTPALAGIAVANVSVAYDDAAAYRALAGTSGYFDFSNVHAYNSSQAGILANMLPSVGSAATLAAGKPFVITESGYTTDPAFGTLGVDEATQAKLTIATLLDAFAAGAEKTYLYELFDNYQAPGLPEKDHHWGLFRADGSPKPSATALHTLTSLLSANGGAAMAGSFEVSGLGADGHSLSLAKASGATDLMLWRDTSLWDDAIHAAKTIAPTSVTITFSEVQQHVYIYSPVADAAAIASYTDVRSITVPLSDSALVIELGASAPITLPSSGPATVTTDAASLVARLGILQQAGGLAYVELTGSHLLPMSSVASMQDIVATYGDVLAKVSGGFQFEITGSGSGWKSSTLYDPSGQLQSTTTLAFDGAGAVTTASVTRPDGSGEWNNLGITGQTYARDRYVYGAGHVLQSVTRNHADSTLDSVTLYNADGSRVVSTYDATSRPTFKVTTAADGGQSTISYNSTGIQILRQDVTAGGVATQWNYAASGSATVMSVTNPDQSGEWNNYGIAGQSYVRDRYVYGAGHVLQSVTRFRADDTIDSTVSYRADGSDISITGGPAATSTNLLVPTSAHAETAVSADIAARVDQLYLRYDGRHPLADELRSAAARLTADAGAADTLRAELVASADGTAYLTGAIGQLYETWGGRPATAAETAVWCNQMAVNGATLETVRRGVLADPLGTGYTQSVVDQAYLTVLARAPTADERGAWTELFAASLSRPGDVAGTLVTGTPVAGIDALVTRAYEEFGGRVPTLGELATWRETMMNGGTLPRLQADIVADPLGTNYLDAQVTNAYQQWMGRAPTAGELATWHDTFANYGPIEQLKNDLLADSGVMAYQATQLATVFAAHGWGTPSAAAVATMMTSLRSGVTFPDAAIAAGQQESFSVATVATVITGTGQHDQFVVDDVNDQVIVPAGAIGVTISAGVSYTLPANVERLVLTGHANLNGTGNSAANILIGNDGANILAGGGGADELTGGLGADTFVLAPGDVLPPGQASTNITDFSHAEGDRIDLSALRAEPGTALTFLGALAFDHHPGQVRMQAAGSGWDVTIDWDGNGVADMHFLVTSHVGALVVDDFVL